MSRPPIFAELDFDAALARSKEHGKLLLVDTTASWCGPCQVMDRTTWVDDAVVSGLRDRAIVIQVDVDTQVAIAKRLSVKSMPTVVAFDARGVELDRVVGLQKSGELLAWVDALSQGETSLSRMRRNVAANPKDMQLRMRFARKLLEVGLLDESTTEYVWFWNHVLEHEPAMLGVRHSFLVQELRHLVSTHPPARRAFVELRDAAAPPSDVEKNDPDALRDWLSLNDVLGEASASLAWFDADRERIANDGRLARFVELSIVPRLVAADRWADIGALYRAPLAELERITRMRDGMLERAPSGIAEAMVEQLRGFAIRNFRDKTVQLVRALRAAGRDDDARAVAAAARRTDDSPDLEAALVDVMG